MDDDYVLRGDKVRFLSKMSLFFSLLPTDLQKDILSVWVDAQDSGRSLLRALSGLEVACSTADQEALRFLINQLPPFGEYVLHGGTMRGVTSKGSFMQWLQSRNMAARSLLLQEQTIPVQYLGGNPQVTSSAFLKQRDIHSPSSEYSDQAEIPLVLPFVETIFWDRCPYNSSDNLEIVLRACPNVTALKCTPALYLSAAVAACAPNLTSLTVDFFQEDRVTATAEYEIGNSSLEFLRAVGPQLQVLSAKECKMDARLLSVLSDCCSLLQTLELYRTDLSCSIIPILQANKHLSAVGFYGGIDYDEAAEILTTKQVKRLTYCCAQQGYSPGEDCGTFAHMLELHSSDIEYLQFNECTYSAVERSLYVSGEHRQFGGKGELLTILNACPSLTVLEISEVMVSDDLLLLIGKRYGTQLQSLSLWVYPSQSNDVKMLLKLCGPSLRALTLTGKGVSDELMQCIAEHFPRLESLGLLDTKMVSGSRMSDICRGCPNLTVLRMEGQNATQATLQALIDSRLHWKRLEISWRGKCRWFRQQINELPIWPKPSLYISL